ncbi:MAG: DUF1256 domain-containing protein [Bacteroidales bacterium]|nr:DUF1256 domain-containing protein [Bacteroidales bacterium]
MNNIEKLIEEHKQIDIFCIGTPNIKGDAVGPLVGTMLKLHTFEKDVQVLGTIESPINSFTYNTKLEQLRPGALVIAIDAAVGLNLWCYEILQGSINPGSALVKTVSPVGDISIKAYTGTTVGEMLSADSWNVALLAYKITYKLTDLLKVQKRVYI